MTSTLSITSATALFPAPTPTALTALYGSDATSEAIYAALLAAAKQASVSPLPTAAPAVHQVAKVAASNVLLDSTAISPVGFLTSRIEALPSPVAILIGVVLILLGITLSVVGARSLLWLNAWGKPRGTYEGKPYIAGGIGGLFFGGITGALFAALVILLISAHQKEPNLGAWPTLAVICCSFILSTALGGRWRFAAMTCLGLAGGLSLTLLLISTVKPSKLLPRLVLGAIIVPISALLSNLPVTLRSHLIFAALTGSFLFVLGIDTFTHFGFVDVLSLLVAKNGVGDTANPDSIVVPWGSSGANGLLAGWWLCFIASAVWQWWSSIEGAGDVDKAWNTYLGQVVSSSPDPRGTYIRTPTFLQRLFNPNGARASSFAGTEFPRRRPWDDAEKGKDWDSDVDTISAIPVQYGAVRKAVEEAEEDEDAEREEKEWRAEMALAKYQRSGDQASILSGETAVRSISSKGGPKSSKVEDVQTPFSVGAERKQSGYFAKRSPAPASYSPIESPASLTDVKEPTSPCLSTSPSIPTSAPLNAVPATPSLILAVQRINAAQRQARGDIGAALSPSTAGRQDVPEPQEQLIPKRSMSKRRGQSWDDFWGDVVRKTEEKK